MFVIEVLGMKSFAPVEGGPLELMREKSRMLFTVVGTSLKSLKERTTGDQALGLEFLL